jgi:hypothetical protein
MAGAGAKLFVSGNVLTAAQVNTYLMDQTIMRFANDAARTAAFGGAGEPTLAEGMFSYLDDTDALEYYDGSAWVQLAQAQLFLKHKSLVKGQHGNIQQNSFIR